MSACGRHLFNGWRCPVAPRKGSKKVAAAPVVSALPHPKHVEALIGHQAAVFSFEQAFNSGRLAHGWLVCGQEGAGKATLVYTLARRVLKWRKGDAVLPPVVPASDPMFRRVAQGAHPDIRVIEPEKPGGIIKVEDIRTLQGFLSHTAAESVWRVVMIDPADAMNNNAANALLKLLEEPPPHCLLFLVTHRPARLLPTIRSRCRQLLVPPLEQDEFLRVLQAGDVEVPPAQASLLLALAEGSPGLAMQLLQANAPEMYGRWLSLWEGARLSSAAVMAFSDGVGQRDAPENWMAFKRILSLFLSRMVRMVVSGQVPAPLLAGEDVVLNKLAQRHSPQFWLDWWEQCQQEMREVDTVNLDKKLTVQQFAYVMEQGLLP